MKKLTLVLLLLSTTVVAAQTPDIDNTVDPVTSLREQITAASTAPDRTRLQLKLADLLANTGHKPEALAELQKIATSDSYDPIGFYNLGNSFARLGETDWAINAYRTAIEQRKGRYSRASNNLGVILLRVGRWDEAYDALISALKVEGFRYAEASYNLGRLYSARGERDLAAREWRRALVVDPQHDAAAKALANVGNDERIVVASKPSRPKVADAKLAAVVGPTLAPVTKPLTLDQMSFDYLQRARSAAERGKFPEAVENFQRVLKLQGGYFPPASLELSYALINVKRFDEALGKLLEVTKRDGLRYPISYFHLARLYEMKGELKLAEAAFAQAVTASPANAQFLLDLCRVREKMGDFKGALEAFEGFLKLTPEPDQKPARSDERLAELRAKAAN